MNIYLQLLMLIYVSWIPVLYISSAASMLIGALGAIRVINEDGNIRFFVAYTSINQIGFVLLGLTAMSYEGFWASLVYLVVYLLASILFLGVLSRIRLSDNARQWQQVNRLSDLRFLFDNDFKFSRRSDLYMLSITIWSMAGLPPSAGFLGKVALWSSLQQKINKLNNGEVVSEIAQQFPPAGMNDALNPLYPLCALLALSLLVSVISAVYYFKIYELMSGDAYVGETIATARRAEVFHDRSSLVLSVVLVLILLSWFFWVSWSWSENFFSFPPYIMNSIWGEMIDNLTFLEG